MESMAFVHLTMDQKKVELVYLVREYSAVNAYLCLFNLPLC